MTQVFHTEGVPPIRGNSTLAANGSIANNKPALAPTARIAARGIRPVARSWMLVTPGSVQLFVRQVNGLVNWARRGVSHLRSVGRQCPGPGDGLRTVPRRTRVM